MQTSAIKDFEELHHCMGSWTPDSDIIEAKVGYCKKPLPIVKFGLNVLLHAGKANFVALSSVAQGYQQRVTPYMYMMALHVHDGLTCT